MKPTKGWSRRLAAAGTILLVAAVEAAAQAPAEPASPERRIVVSLADRKLAILANGRETRVFEVAVGAASSPSPTGDFRIVNRVARPTYYRPGVVIPPGKDNPIGTRWLGFDKKGYGIHGTNEPNSVGTAASHGCIRMRNRDVEKFFAMVRVGDRVEIVGEPNELTTALFGPGPGEVAPAGGVEVARASE